MTTMSDALNRIQAQNQAEADSGRIATAKAELLELDRSLTSARDAARGYKDPHLTPEGLQAKREALDVAARQTAAPVLARLRAQVDLAAARLAAQASAAMPQYDDDQAATARTAAKWAQVVMRLDAGIPLVTVLAGADVETTLAVREYGPAWTEAQLHTAAGGGVLGLRPAPDHAPLMRSIDTRLAELSGPSVVGALAAAQDAAAVAAYVGVSADHLDDVLTGTRTAVSDIGAAVGAQYAEQAARAGLVEDDAARTDRT